MEETDNNHLPPATPGTSGAPLKSALKSPGAPPKSAAILSPTFREEQIAEKREVQTEKVQAQDLKTKFRVRVAKFVLRGVNFSCSLIVVSMLATTFTIFNATKNLPLRDGMPAWNQPTPIWPQIVLLVIASLSLFMSAFIFWAYLRNRQRRAQKAAVYYTTFSVIFFLFSIIMWAVGGGIINQVKNSSGGIDIWGWSCKDNLRKDLFQNDVNYNLVCRLNNWSLVCCIIEVVVEVFTILVYAIVFYRFYSQRKLRKSMAVRDRARSDLYLAQLRAQSAPNTPAPFSPRDGGWMAPPGHPLYNDPHSAAEAGVQYATVQSPRTITPPKPFALQPPPIRVQGATPKPAQNGFDKPLPSAGPSSPPLSPGVFEMQQAHVPAAPGERQYEAVPIPGAYASPINSPGVPPPAVQPLGGFDFGESVTGKQR